VDAEVAWGNDGAADTDKASVWQWLAMVDQTGQGVCTSTINRGNSRENRLLKSATQLPFWCFYAPIGP